jgi:hypothetical protein
MAIAGTYGTLQNRIVDELGDRSDLKAPLLTASAASSPIKRAIQSAIAKWEREPFYFTEFYNSSFFTTVNAQEFYTSSDAAAIATVVQITRAHVTISGTRYALVPRRWNYIEDIQPGTTTGSPTDYAYFAEQIRLYPIPTAALVISVSGNQRLSALSADADSNGWTTDGFDLIRCEALLMLASEMIHDEALAAAMERAIYGDPANPNRKGYLAALREETMTRGRPGLSRAAGDPPKGG